MIGKWTLQKKKHLMTLFHVVFLSLALFCISFLYLHNQSGQGLGWLIHDQYEDTSLFSDQLLMDIEEIFNYTNYKDIFETNGKLDFSKPIIKVMKSPGKIETFTIDEMVRYAKSRGLYLNDQFKITGQVNPSVEEDFEEVFVEWKSYDPNLRFDEPGDAYVSFDVLAEEILSHLGNYYSFYYKFIQNSSNLKFRILYEKNDSTYELHTNTALSAPEDFQNLGKYIVVTSSSVIMDSNLRTEPKNILALLESNNPFPSGSYTMMIGFDSSYSAHDSYYDGSADYGKIRMQIIGCLVLLGLSMTGCFITLCYLLIVSGYEDFKKTNVILYRLDKNTTEIGILTIFTVTIFLLFLGTKIATPLIHLVTKQENWYYFERLLSYIIFYFSAMILFFSLLRRYRAEVIWTQSLLRRGISSTLIYLERRRFTTRLSVLFISYFIINLTLIFFSSYLLVQLEFLEIKILPVILLLLTFTINLLAFYYLYKGAWQYDRIGEGIMQISSGQTSYKIDISSFSGKEKELASSINHISSGLETALEEQVKSERLKADLITNVSHDIKTPLTSIINYVDLIKREQIQNEKLQSYLDVLEQKSQRLKNLTEDLVEASKASSGNLKLDITTIDLVQLIHQVNGEFEETFLAKHLEIISHINSMETLILGDGKRLWRVFENLYNNAYKYAMSHSRIYIDLWICEEVVYYTIKNISEQPLNIHANELTERFVRGDVARTTEGSGLGLSIAKSLTQLQNGTFDIYIDGDLFKVELTFPLYKKTDDLETTP